MPQDSVANASIPADRKEARQLLRRRHRRFLYEHFSVDRLGGALRFKFTFRIEPDLVFAPEMTIELIESERLQSLPAGVLENLAFNIGLVEMLSYWKAACSPEIVVEAGALDADQIGWWMDLLLHGMGEFFYVNGIDYRSPDFVRIASPQEGVILSEAKDLLVPTARDSRETDLVLTSGGKDSVVTLELLREAGREFDCLLLNPAEAALAVARQAGCRRTIIVSRTIDPRLLELNAAGYLNGHTPFSALLAFVGVMVAALCGSGRVIVSNERSAEEAAAEFLGRDVNHQYSKSFRFETLFRAYSQKYLAPGIEYLSLLRPLYELQIAALFARYSQYFPLFRSCNRGMKTNSWCGRCPKCLFVFTALYPFVGREQMLAIFGEDLFTRDGAVAVLRQLLGLDRDKPFECVGTREETLAALYLCVQKYKQQGIAVPAALRSIEETALSAHADLAEVARRVLGAWTEDHHLPSELADLLRRKILAPNP